MPDLEPGRSIVLVAMPWAVLELPSISLGILTAVLRTAGIDPVVRPYYVTFLEYLNRTRGGDAPVSPNDYNLLANTQPVTGIADWVFAVPPFRDPAPERDAELMAMLRTGGDVAPEAIEHAQRFRERVPGFIEECVADILQQRPAMVGFTTTFCQNVPSLAVAQALKARDPSVRIVFGGANCDGPMGQALFDAFPWIDAVVQGEGEVVAVELARAALAGRDFSAGPSVLVRSPRPRLLVRPTAAAAGAEPERVRMDEIPTPDYDFYFDTLAGCEFHDEVLARVRLPVETARGCWWGQKNHCTFCGLNGSTMAFRAKSIERALHDFTSLAARYRCLDFAAVDNIIDLGYLSELMPRLRDTGFDLNIFYETKSNLTKQQVRAMSEGGIRRIQPGIESLSTPILKLMKKGVTAWQNVRLLKWCAQYGIHVDWNIIYGFPGEPTDEYARMAAALPALSHLDPPNFIRMRVQRFSPYHQRPAEYGIRLDGPTPQYGCVFPGHVRLDDLAYYFDFTHDDGRNPADYTGAIRTQIDEWTERFERNRGALMYRHGPDFIRIIDGREPFDHTRYVLEGREAALYLACDGGATVPAVCRELVAQGYPTPDPGEVESFLRELVEARLMFEGDNRFVSLALPVQPDREAVRRGHQQPAADDAAA